MNSIVQPSRAYLYVVSCLFLVLTVTVFSVCYASGTEDVQVSGDIKAGFRILEVDPLNPVGSFTVYRGDYIKLSYPKRFGQLSFMVESLKYSGIVSSEPDLSPFYKMKQAGTYPFTLGEGGGTITVIELIRPNYIEVTAEEGFELLQNRELFILDVRTPQEYEQLHLAQSHLLPIQALQGRIGELEGEKYEDIFVYCATGNRSTVAARILADKGFKRIYNLRQGVYDWARKGYPYEKGK